MVVLEPRRLAARMAARRVAEEMGERPGETVGWQVRFEEVAGPRTRLRYVTEGLLTRRLVADPDCPASAWSCSTSSTSATSRATWRWRCCAACRRPPARTCELVAMSATLDAAPVARFLDAPSVRSEGRLFEVAVEHLTPADAARDDRLEDRVASAVRRVVTETPDGDVLVFLPGMAEIRRAAQACASFAARLGLDVLPLHGDLSPEEQDRAVRPGPRRKVVLSTNVAESSVTIDGVTAVVDSGLARVASHSPWSGLPRLEVRRVSRASATQRAGRAGRTAPGRCLRLYTRHDFDTRPEFDVPEILREDLSETAPRRGLDGGTGAPLARRAARTPPRRRPASCSATSARSTRPAPSRRADGGSCASRSTPAWRGSWWRPTTGEPGRPARCSPRCSPSGTCGSAPRTGDAARRPPAPPTCSSWPTSSSRRRRSRFDPDRLRSLGLSPGAVQAVERSRRQVAQLLGRGPARRPAAAEDSEEALLLATLAAYPDRRGAAARAREPRGGPGRGRLGPARRGERGARRAAARGGGRRRAARPARPRVLPRPPGAAGRCSCASPPRPPRR